MKVIFLALLSACGCGTGHCPPSSPISLAGDPDIRVLQAPFKPEPGSYALVLDHCFRIEHVQLEVNPPAEPEIGMQASWRSSGGVAVHADITGPYNHPRLQLSSDPPLPEAKLIALLLEPATRTDARNCPRQKH